MRRGMIHVRLHARRRFVCSSPCTAVLRRELLLELLQVRRLRWQVLGGAFVCSRCRCLVLRLGRPPRLQLLHVVLVVLRPRWVPLCGLAQVSRRAEVGRTHCACGLWVPDMARGRYMAWAEVVGTCRGSLVYFGRHRRRRRWLARGRSSERCPVGKVLSVQACGRFVSTSLVRVEREPTWVGA
jgi:hypothetical protein